MKRNAGFDLLIGLCFICVFAACLFFVLASGARVYKGVSEVMEEQYTERTAMGYLTTKLRQSDSRGMVSLGSLGGTEAIVISENIDGTDYNTFIYCHAGSIMELFCPASEVLQPTDGLPVIAAESLSFELRGNVLYLTCETAGGSGQSAVCLRSERGDAA